MSVDIKKLSYIRILTARELPSYIEIYYNLGQENNIYVAPHFIFPNTTTEFYSPILSPGIPEGYEISNEFEIGSSFKYNDIYEKIKILDEGNNNEVLMKKDGILLWVDINEIKSDN